MSVLFFVSKGEIKKGHNKTVQENGIYNESACILGRNRYFVCDLLILFAAEFCVARRSSQRDLPQFS